MNGNMVNHTKVQKFVECSAIRAHVTSHVTGYSSGKGAITVTVIIYVYQVFPLNNLGSAPLHYVG